MKKNRLFILLSLVITLFTVSCTDLIQELFPRNLHTIKFNALDFDWPSFSFKSSKSSNDLIAKTTANSNDEIEITFDGYGDAQVTVTGPSGEEVIVKIHVNTDDTITVDYITSGDKRDIHKDISFPGDDVLEKTTEVWKDTTTVDTTRTTKPDKSYTEDKVIKYPDKSETDIERKGNPDGSYTETITKKSPQGTVTDNLEKNVDKDGKSTTKDKDGNYLNEISPLELNIEDIDKITTDPATQTVITVTKTPNGGIEYRGQNPGGPVTITITDKKGHPAVIKVTVNPDKTLTEEITPYYDSKKKTIPLTDLAPLTGVEKIIVADPTIITVIKDPTGGTGIEITSKKPGTTTVILKDPTGTGIQITITTDTDGNITIDDKAPYNYPTKTKTLSPEDCKLPTIKSVTPEKTDYAKVEVKDGKLVITSTSDSGTNTSEFTVTADDGTKKVVVITTDDEGNITVKEVKDKKAGSSCSIKYKATEKLADGKRFDVGSPLLGQTIVEHTFDAATGEGVISVANDITVIYWNDFSNMTTLTEITIPDTVSKLSEYKDNATAGAFEGCTNLSKVTFENDGPNITEIGSCVFRKCSKLEEIKLPATCTTISDFAFDDAGLKKIESNAVTKVSLCAFRNCSNLETVNLPEVTVIEGSSFEACSRLTEITFTKIEELNAKQGFWNCSNLVTVNLPNLKKITHGHNLFAGCSNLEKINAPLLTEVADADAGLYNCFKLDYQSIFDNIEILDSPNFTAIGINPETYDCNQVILPKVKRIGDDFKIYTQIRRLVIGPEIQSIGKNLIEPVYANENGSYIVFKGKIPPTLGETETKFLNKIFVPKGTKATYVAAWPHIPADKIEEGPVYSVRFYPNGGFGEMMEEQKFFEDEKQNISKCTYKYSGAIFTGWNTKADGSGTSYTDEESISISQWVDLFAQWKVLVRQLPRGSTNGSNSYNGDYVEFGEWPQTKKTGAVTVDESVTKTAGMYTYYKGSDGAWYAKTGPDYFKVEPIKWRVASPSYVVDGDAGKVTGKLLVAENILTANVPYYEDTSDRTIDDNTVYANNYKHSQIRAYLNGINYQGPAEEVTKWDGKGFFQTAFNTDEQKLIYTTKVDNTEDSTTDFRGNLEKASSYVCESTEDKVFLLSELEITTICDASYDESDTKRVRVATDFAKANNANQSTIQDYGGIWWLRSPSSIGSSYEHVVSDSGIAMGFGSVYKMDYGIVPVLCISY